MTPDKNPCSENMRNLTIRLCAEWEAQDAVLMTWPHTDSDWQLNLADAEAVYVEIATEILKTQNLIIIVRNQDHLQQVESLLAPADRRPDYFIAVTNDTWIRDYGPLSIEIDLKPLLMNFSFNSWGGKYPYQLDNTVSTKISESGLFRKMLSHQFRLEGGAIECDGSGTFMATRSSVISDTRNPGMNQPQIEELLTEILGLSRFLWIDCDGITGDDTDGHIDTLARFIDDKTIVYTTLQPSHPDYRAVQSLQHQLESFRRADGEAYRLVPLPPPPDRHSEYDGRRLAASYANFLFINHAVLLPVYGDKSDAIAIDVLSQSCNREVIPINSNALIEQNGSLHCATMQLSTGTTVFDKIHP